MPMDCQSLGISQFRGTDLELQFWCAGQLEIPRCSSYLLLDVSMRLIVPFFTINLIIPYKN